MYDLTKIPKEESTIYLEEGQFLGDVKTKFNDFKKGLPEGILNKQYTGIGATTVEFKSERKSIIVFPYRKIAQEKFHKWENSKKVFYVGTNENNKSNSIEDIAYFVKENRDEDLKFCVVADSIDKVVKGIEKAELDPYGDDFFLVLDEVEILQLQSGFRGRLPLCFDYFKKFKRKCLVSATLLDFSDKEIQKLPVYHVEKVLLDKEIGHIKYKEKIDFKQYKSNFPHIEVAQDILSFYKKDPNYSNYKFFIGLNSKEAIKQFIEEIEKVSPEITISVIVSEQSSDDFFDKYTKPKIVKGKLPCQINLSTCIAWSGIDIEEQFFSVAISLNNKVHHSFSIENLIQFFGRCRLPRGQQLSKTFVVGKEVGLRYIKPDGDYIERIDNLESLIKFVDKTIKSKADKNFLYSSLMSDKYNLIYSDIKNKPKANWLLKDLEIYTLNVVDDYKDIEYGLLKKLQERYTIDKKPTLFKEIEIYEKSSDEKLEERLEILISNFEHDYPNSKLINHVRKNRMPTLRLAAFWYLFGRKVLKNDEDGLKLAKYYSGFENYLPTNSLLHITKITLDSIYLYQFEKQLWEDLINQMKALCKVGKKKNTKEFISIFKSLRFSNYFPSLIFSKNQASSIGLFIKFILGVSRSGKSGGSDTFMIEDGIAYIPMIYTNYPSLELHLGKVSKFPKEKVGVSFGKVSIHNILQEDFIKL